jgi:2-amino-4-hydroxy-6-hydroxymethyldihydropteridine diphosphokinase
VRVFLGLGSNVGDSVAHLDTARNQLQENRVRILRASSEEVTKPVGNADQSDFRNQVLEVDTDLAPMELLAVAKKLELRAGRQEGRGRWGPRELDIDILLYGGLVMESPELTIPHAEMLNRGFVLREMLEIDPDLEDPKTGQALRRVLAALSGG